MTKLRILLIIFTLSLAGVADAAPSSDSAVGWSPDSRSLIVAIGGSNPSISGFSLQGEKLWSRAGLPHPFLVEVDPNSSRMALLDAMSDLVQILDSRGDSSFLLAVPATPIAVEFHDEDAIILCRDGHKLLRIRSGRIEQTADLPPGTAFLQRHDDSVLVYSSITGEMLQLDALTLTVRHALQLDRFASDLEADKNNAYLVYPRGGTVAVVSIPEMKPAGRLTIGAVPVDLAIDRSATLLSAGALNVVDPASRAVLKEEASQSPAAAFGRGFLRGLIGLGLKTGSGRQFPSAVDRVFSDGPRVLAYDSAARTLYRVIGKGSELVARDVDPAGFAFVPRGIAFWNRLTDWVTVVPDP